MENLRELFSRNVSVSSVIYDGIIKNDYGKTEPIYFESVPSFGKERTTFAYIGIPSSKKPKNGYPAVVLVHGGGGCAYFEWVEYWNSKGYVAISFDCVGRQFGGIQRLRLDTDANDRKKAERNPKGRTVLPDDSGSFEYNETNRFDSWTYYNEANIILAHNILLSMDCVDKKNTFITGISWGGVLTAISSGIDDRFRAFAPVYGTGYLLESPIFRDIKPTMTESAEVWEEYFDPKDFVKNNKKPVLYTCGTDDRAFSLIGAQKTYGSSGGKVYYSYRLNLPHHHRWRDDESMIHISKFFDSFAKGVKLSFEIISERYEDGNFEIGLSNPQVVDKIYLNYTVSKTDDSLELEWKHIEITGYNSVITVKLPENTHYCFFELLGESDFVLSSSLLML